jgi:hypothetical protein
MTAKSKMIEKMLENGMSPRKISRAMDVSREWVRHIQYRYEARKYKQLYEQLLEQVNRH